MSREGITVELAVVANDAFQPDPRTEIARILRDLADRIEGGLEDGTARLRDFNGNTVGLATIQLGENTA